MKSLRKLQVHSLQFIQVVQEDLQNPEKSQGFSHKLHLSCININKNEKNIFLHPDF